MVDRDALAALARPLLARCTFPTGPLTCAVSGGADSTALLLLAVATSAPVTAVHVDHGLRRSSADDAAHVESFAASLGVPVVVRRVDVVAGANLEARARQLRYAALPDDVCTGHTADDVAETVLINLLRGAGIDGLAPMVRATRGPHRPLLYLRRAETIALCRSLGLVVVHDDMNTDVRFQRVRVRHQVMPLLDDIAQRDVAGIIARQAALLGDDADFLETLARALDPCDASSLRAAPAPLARRAVRRWLIDSGVGDGHPPDSAAVERVLDVARLRAVSTDVFDGWRVLRTAGRLRLEHRGGATGGPSTLPQL